MNTSSTNDALDSNVDKNEISESGTEFERTVTIIQEADGIVHVSNNENKLAKDEHTSDQADQKQPSPVLHNHHASVGHTENNQLGEADDTLQEIQHLEAVAKAAENSDQSAMDSALLAETRDSFQTEGHANVRQITEEDKALWQRLLSECEFIKPIGTLHGYTSSNEEFLRMKAKYEEISMTTYMIKTIHRTQSNATGGPNELAVWFEDQVPKGRQQINVFDGIPFIKRGAYTYECHMGHLKSRQRDRPMTDRKRKSILKKVGCTSQIFLRDVVKFPELKLTGENERAERSRISSLVRNELLYNCEYGEPRFYFLLPTLKSHEPQHTIQESVSKNPVHPQISEYVLKLVGDGERKTDEILEKVDLFIQNELCRGWAEQLHPEDGRFHPDKNYVRNKIYKWKREHPEEELQFADDSLDDAGQNIVEGIILEDLQHGHAIAHHLRKGCTDVFMEILRLIDYERETESVSELSWVLNKVFDYFQQLKNRDGNQSILPNARENETTLPQYLFNQMHLLQPEMCAAETQTELICVVEAPTPATPRHRNQACTVILDTDGKACKGNCCYKHGGKRPPEPSDEHRSPVKPVTPQTHSAKHTGKKPAPKRKLQSTTRKENIQQNLVQIKREKQDDVAQKQSHLNDTDIDNETNTQVLSPETPTNIMVTVKQSPTRRGTSGKSSVKAPQKRIGGKVRKKRQNKQVFAEPRTDINQVKIMPKVCSLRKQQAISSPGENETSYGITITDNECSWTTASSNTA